MRHTHTHTRSGIARASRVVVIAASRGCASFASRLLPRASRRVSLAVLRRDFLRDEAVNDYSFWNIVYTPYSGRLTATDERRNEYRTQRRRKTRLTRSPETYFSVGKELYGYDVLISVESGVL